MNLFRHRVTQFKEKLFFPNLTREYGADFPDQQDLYSIDQLGRHGETVARQHELDDRSGRDLLLGRLDSNKTIIDETYRMISSENHDKNSLSPAAVWLLDNYYLIKEQIWTVRNHLPKKYSVELPRLRSGPSAGLPRVFDLVSELISHVDGRVDEGSLGSIVSSYQRVHTLQLGELWAIPIMLRLALIENLRRIAGRIASGRKDRNLANYWAERMLKAAGKNPNSMIIEMAEMVKADIPMSCAFVGEFYRKLQRQNPVLFLPLNWLERRLEEKGQTIEGQVRMDSQQQASLQISISNSIGSLRFLSAINWKNFVENMSRVEQILRTDPAGVYARMSFATRDRYRHVVEKMARQGRRDESSVAAQAVEMAGAAEPSDHRARHVGFYLVDRGRRSLERKIRMRLTAGDLVSRIGRSAPLLFYLGSVMALTAGLTAMVVPWVPAAGPVPFWVLCIILALGFSPAAVTLVNWLATVLVRPELLPRMDYAQSIPPESVTLVTVPCMLTGEKHVRELINKIEVAYLANRSEHLFFSLLADFPDACQETMPDDAKLLELILENIRQLNRKYQGDGLGPFYLFHRPRQWNPAEKVWMGYERKRGKLEALNHAILNGKSPGLLIEGDLGMLRRVRYVITLDTDTQLPHGSARQMIETIAHPLNAPVFDPVHQRVRSGYVLLQPRIVSSLQATRRSLFSRIFGSESGIDPYTRAVSDVYQDVFGEGSFIGKGIYQVDMFSRILSDRLPENRILSHDLLEGNYVRSGLMSDIQLTEDFPQSYSEDMARRHRWIRGDWQIASWLFPRVPGFRKRSVPNPVSCLSRWKILDNLRRSLVPLALFLLVAGAWFVHPVWWSGLAVVLAVLVVPLLPPAILHAFRKPERYPLALHLRTVASVLGRHLFQAFFSLAVLPYEAAYNLDAILRTTWRLLVSRRKLLEWTTSGEARRKAGKNILSYFRLMFWAPGITLLLAAVFYVWNRVPTPDQWALLGLWFVLPVLCWWISRPVRKRQPVVSSSQKDYLRTVARKTWRYFETFVGPEDHWLPPDNYQEEPSVILARMTSPTNIGFLLISTLGACDLGYLSAGQMIDRIRKTFRTLDSLERFRGHFYNWYDTRTLQPLTPRYISTVDSGNLAGHLYTLQSGLMELQNHRICDPAIYSGIVDVLRIVEELPGFVSGDNAKLLRERLASLRQSVSRNETENPGLTAILGNLTGWSTQIDQIRTEAGTDMDGDADWWLKRLQAQFQNQQEDILFLVPWLGMLEDEGFELAPSVRDLLDANLTLADIARYERQLPDLMAQNADHETGSEHRVIDRDKWNRIIRQGAHRAAARFAQLEELALKCQEYAEQTYDFLFDSSRNLLAIGYDAGQHRRDESYYDLLASEARLASFIGVARGQLPLDHWFALGRLVTIWKGKTILLSWGGSMFEYLMPQLVMPGYEETLIGQSCRAAVEKQVAYAKKNGVPWGISESAENMTDSALKYQYRSFGIPELGFKRGLADDLVIAPYASILALSVRPDWVCSNLQRMKFCGFEGRYGFYEAVDYTASRLAQGETEALIRSFMAHHQGMSFVSFVNYFTGDRMVKRFQSHSLFQTAVLLLQERIPQAPPFQMWYTEPVRPDRVPETREEFMRVFDTSQTNIPEVHLLSNGRYHVMVTNAGGGYSRWRNLSLTRWSEDTTRDNHGTFIYIRDAGGEGRWSSAYQPTLSEPSSYEAVFSQAKAEYKRRDQGLDTYTEIAVSPEDDIEYRRISISNFSVRSRAVELTSFSEVSLMDVPAEELHPAFDKLFIRTEIVPEHQAILCTRRPRSPEEKPPWMFHLFVHDETEPLDVSYETDRMKFIGRGRTVQNPLALEETGPLSGTAGEVLDPSLSIRCGFKLKSGESRTVGYITGIADTREQALALVEKYKDRRIADRVFDIALIHGRVVLQQINATEANAQLFGRLASSIIYPGLDRRAGADILLKNNRGQSALWAYGISGDLPIVLLRISDHEKIHLAAQMIQAHVYWRLKGLPVDLIIWNEDWSGYRQVLQDQLMGLVAVGSESSHFDRPGGIFIRYPDQMSEEDRVLMLASARVIITDSGGTLAEQIRHYVQTEMPEHKIMNPRAGKPDEDREYFRQTGLEYPNGWGGFTKDGREYIFQVKPGTPPPMPWVNLVANKRIGSVITQSGGYTWFENAHEFRLTPWYNDPVTDASGEVIYLRDENSANFWSVTPLPAPAYGDYLNRQGFGYTVFEYAVHDIKTELWIYVDPVDPVKFFLLKARNDSDIIRRMSAVSFFEMVLGEKRSRTQMHVRTEVDEKTGALFATNPFQTDFPGRVAFLEANEARRSVSGDRMEFIGRNGSLSDPVALHRAHLSGRVGAGFDPAMALQVFFELEPGQEKDIVFILGAGQDVEEARRLVLRHRGTLPAFEARDRVWQYWNHTLGTINVETPDPAVNYLANGWLSYQAMTSRLFGRSGFYQSGGAFGFRDQLQDVSALLFAEPGLVRDHLLLCASRQFTAGDVQHWWHPPLGRGVRTRISDDALWLPFVTSQYVLRTGDTGVLEEYAGFLDSRPLNPGEDSNYDLPVRAEESAPLYEHCRRAIRQAFRYGRRGLPLMGSGDWNDGMNRVGVGGDGESVWLAFFQIAVLEQFAPLARMRGDENFALECENQSSRLKTAVEENAWDGDWYCRAFADDGTVLGSSKSPECRIDSIAQSWSVLSGAAPRDRAVSSMKSLLSHLVDWEKGLILLLDPPFDRSSLDPGYIKGYVPGVRENGGQYTHAAVWAIMAFAKMGEKETVRKLLEMINPIHHGSSPERIATYRIEPYVMAGDVYSSKNQAGRGGWSWYTGSAAWMYRLIIESVLGMDLRVDHLYLKPCLPDSWDVIRIHYRYRETVYHMEIHQGPADRDIQFVADGTELPDDFLPLVDDRKEHYVTVHIRK